MVLSEVRQCQKGSEVFRVLRVGILVGIGAPNWHDLLRALTRLRQPKK